MAVGAESIPAQPLLLPPPNWGRRSPGYLCFPVLLLLLLLLLTLGVLQTSAAGPTAPADPWLWAAVRPSAGPGLGPAGRAAGEASRTVGRGAADMRWPGGGPPGPTAPSRFVEQGLAAWASPAVWWVSVASLLSALVVSGLRHRASGWTMAAGHGATDADSGEAAAAVPVHWDSQALRGTAYPMRVVGSPPPPGGLLDVVIPGNPGLAEFYGPFVQGLLAQGHTAVALGYANFAAAPPPGGSLRIEDEAELKRLQLRALVGGGGEDGRPGRLRLAGHSIGAWIALQCLEDPVLCDATDQVVLMFPFVARNERSGTQRLINRLLRSAAAVELALLAVRLACCLPHALKRLVMAAAAPGLAPAAQEVALESLLRRPFHCRSVLEMALSEFLVLDDGRAPLPAAAQQIQRLCDRGVRVTVLYAAADHWAPLWQREHLDALVASPRYRSMAVDADHAFPAFQKDTAQLLSAWPRITAVPTAAPPPGPASH